MHATTGVNCRDKSIFGHHAVRFRCECQFLLRLSVPKAHKHLGLCQDHMHARTPAMIRCDSQIRLTRAEVEYFRWLTNIEPAGIRTLADLKSYVAQCKAHYWGHSPDTQFLHWMIDKEVAKCLAA
jgi:hypothetical protein